MSKKRKSLIVNKESAVYEEINWAEKGMDLTEE